MSISIFRLTLPLTLVAAVLTIATAFASSKKTGNPRLPAVAPDPQPTPSGQILVRPRIAGEFIYDATVKNLKGESLELGSLLTNRFSIVVFSKPEHISLERARGYFKRIAPYLLKLGYQIILVASRKDESLNDVALRLKGDTGAVVIDETQQVFVAMGLADRPTKDEAAINAIYVVAPNKQILFSFASVSDSIPFSGEVLVLAARVYKEAFEAPARQSEVK
jgi:hypothetical protein